MDLKYAEMDHKFEETDQQNEIFWVFEKSGNGSNYTLVKFFKNKWWLHTQII